MLETGTDRGESDVKNVNERKEKLRGGETGREWYERSLQYMEDRGRVEE